VALFRNHRRAWFSKKRLTVSGIAFGFIALIAQHGGFCLSCVAGVAALAVSFKTNIARCLW